MKPRRATIDRLEVVRFYPARNTTELAIRLQRAGYAPPTGRRWDAHLALQQLYAWERHGLATATRDASGAMSKYGFKVMNGVVQYAPRDIRPTPSGRRILQDIELRGLVSSCCQCCQGLI